MPNDISPLKTLNARQSAFVKEYVAGGNPHQAALASGYAEGTARVAGTQLLEMPNIAYAIAREVRQRLVTGAPAALRTIEWLMENSPSHKVRLDCAKTLLDRGGHPALRPQEDNRGAEIPLHELSTDQLHAMIARWTDEVADRAKDVTPDSAAADLIGDN